MPPATPRPARPRRQSAKVLVPTVRSAACTSACTSAWPQPHRANQSARVNQSAESRKLSQSPPATLRPAVGMLSGCTRSAGAPRRRVTRSPAGFRGAASRTTHSGAWPDKIKPSRNLENASAQPAFLEQTRKFSAHLNAQVSFYCSGGRQGKQTTTWVELSWPSINSSLRAGRSDMIWTPWHARYNYSTRAWVSRTAHRE